LEQTPSENPFQSPAIDSSGYAERLKGRSSELEAIDWILAVFCGGIACIVGIVWMIQGKPKGVKMVGLSILFAVIWSIVRVLAAYLMNSL
jgi:hypothetical protein